MPISAWTPKGFLLKVLMPFAVLSGALMLALTDNTTPSNSRPGVVIAMSMPPSWQDLPTTPPLEDEWDYPNELPTFDIWSANPDPSKMIIFVYARHKKTGAVDLRQIFYEFNGTKRAPVLINELWVQRFREKYAMVWKVSIPQDGWSVQLQLPVTDHWSDSKDKAEVVFYWRYRWVYDLTLRLDDVKLVDKFGNVNRASDWPSNATEWLNRLKYEVERLLSTSSHGLRSV